MPRILLSLLLVAACKKADGPSTEGDTDTDADADADSDADADTDTADFDTDVPRPDCPNDGKALVVANIVGGPTITVADRVTVNFFPTYPGPPVYYYVRTGADFTSLPAFARDNNVPTGTYQTVIVCLDANSDTLDMCDGPNDVIVEIPDLTLAAGDVVSVDVDFSAVTVTTPTNLGAPKDCP